MIAAPKAIIAAKLVSVEQLRRATRLNSFSLQKKFDELPPLIDLLVDVDRSRALRHLGDDNSGPTLIEVGDDPLRIEGFVGDEAAELYILEKWCNADCIVALAGKQHKADKIARRVGEGHYFGGQTTSRLAYGLPS